MVLTNISINDKLYYRLIIIKQTHHNIIHCNCARSVSSNFYNCFDNNKAMVKVNAGTCVLKQYYYIDLVIDIYYI